MPNVSYFGSVWETQAEDSFPLDLYLHEIRNGRWEDLCNTIRTRKSEKEKDKLKEKIPRVTFSGIFGTRSDTGLKQHSNYIAIDLDDLEDTEGTKDLLSDDRYVYACFLSTGGHGLTVLFKINGEKHRESFLGISSYLLVNYGLITDVGSIAVSKPFGVTFDPNLFVNDEEVPVFKQYPKERKVEKIPSFAYAKDDFDQLLKTIVTRGINLCENYDEWLKIGFAFSSKFGEAGRDYFHIISSVSKKYNVQKTDAQFKYCLRSKNLNIATISTFYWYCKQAGLQITSERTSKIRKATMNGKAAGLSKKQIIKNLSEQNITEADEIVEEVFDGSALDGAGGDNYLEQLELFITTNYSIERNELTRFLEMNGKDLNQRDLNSIYIAAKKQIREINYDITERLLISDFVAQYNPIQRFFTNLPVVDVMDKDGEYCTPIINKLASTIINDVELYTEYFLRKWLVSIVAAAHYDHSPLVFVLVGERQGTGKTEWFRRLFPKELKRYYAESKLDAGKDDDILMTQKLIIMDDEMAGKSKLQVQRLKELTSKENFSLREPYGRQNVDLPRLAVLCGTSNFKTLLNDPTGNRRMIPTEVDDIDQKLYNSINKMDLFSEIYSLWKIGFDWRVISKADREYLRKYETQYETINLEAELLLKYFAQDEKGIWLMSSEIKVEIEKLTMQKLSLDQLGKQLSKFGFPTQSKRINGVIGSERKRWGVVRTNRPGEFTLPESKDKKDNDEEEAPF